MNVKTLCKTYRIGAANVVVIFTAIGKRSQPPLIKGGLSKKEKHTERESSISVIPQKRNTIPLQYLKVLSYFFCFITHYQDDSLSSLPLNLFS